MTDFEWIRRRQFIAIATGKFEGDSSYQDLPQVADEVGLITAWLTDEGLGARRFARAYDELQADPSYDQIQARFRNPPRDDRWNRSDATVVYITGHGALSSNHARTQHFLVLNQTDGTRLAATALATDQLLHWLADTDIEYLLMIIDVCFAGQVTEELAGWARDHWLILPSAMPDQQAEPGALAKAISGYLKTAAEFNTHAPYLTVGVFVNALNELLPPDQQIGRIYKGGRGRSSADPDRERHICLPNPSYRPRDELVGTDPVRQALALSKDLFRLHNRVSGRMPSADSPGWLLTGRKRLMRDLIRGAARPGVLALTGSAGCGKSIVLARLVTLSDPDFRRRYARELRGVPEDLMPRQGAVDVALSARGRSSRQVAAQICHDLGALGQTGSWDDPVRANLEALNEWLTSREGPVTIVIDALDEANDPADLVRNVLAPLGRRHLRRLCLVVGVRSADGHRSAAEEQGEPQDSLAELMAAVPGARQIRADDDLRWSRRDITTFVRNILVNNMKSPYRKADPQAVQRTAEVIGRLAGRSYLMAGVAAGSAAERTVIMAPDDSSWLNELKGGLLGVFRGDLRASLPSPGDIRRGVALLRSVAFARGRGLPRHRIWPKVATAVDAADGAGSEYGDADVRWLLQSRLNAYLVTDQEDDLTVYRLIHDELRDILRYRWRELLTEPPATAEPATPDADHDAPPPAGEAEIVAVEARIARELRGWAEVEPSVAVNQSVPVYVRRHLAEYAIAGNVLDRYVPVSFLPYLDLARLRAAAGASSARQQLERSVPWLPVVRRVTHLWDWDRPERNAAAIEMWASLGNVRLPGLVGGPWQVRWAVQPPDMSNVLGHHKEIPRAAAAAELTGGPVVVTGGEDGFLHVWDLSTGARYRDREPIDARDDGAGDGVIRSIATARLPNGHTVAVTGCTDGAISVWDLESGHALGDALYRGEQAIEAVMTTVLPDRRIIITAADAAGVVRSWDLISRAPVGEPVSCGPGMALGLAAARIGGQVLGLATGQDSGLQTWTLATGVPVGKRLTDHPLSEQPATGTLQGGRAIAVASLAGLEVAVTSNGDGLVMWDLREQAAIPRRLRGGDGTIRALAAARVNHRVIAVTGGNRTVQAWDLAAGEPIGELLTGHDGSVEAVTIAGSAAGSPDDALLAVSASRDRSVRIWEVPGDVLPAEGSARPVGIVETVTTARSPKGRVLAITGSHTDVQVWDLEHGGNPLRLTGHDSPVVAVTAAELAEGVLAVAGHWDGWISAWWADGRQVSGGQAQEPGAAAVLATAVLADGWVVAVAGGWDGGLRVWDPAVGGPVGEILRGHIGAVVAVATATTADGRTLVISGGKDGHVRIRDLGAHVDPEQTAPRPPVDVDTGTEIASLTVTAGGRPCVVIGGEDGTVRMLDVLDGQALGEPWLACDGAVAAVAADQSPDGRGVVFTGGAESLVQAWDAGSGTPVGAALPVPGPILAMAFKGDPASLVVGGTGIAVVRPLHGTYRHVG